MDFVDSGDRGTFLHLQDTFSSYSSITFIRTKTEKGQTDGKVSHVVLTQCASFFGTPCILLNCKDPRFNGSEFSQ